MLSLISTFWNDNEKNIYKFFTGLFASMTILLLVFLVAASRLFVSENNLRTQFASKNWELTSEVEALRNTLESRDLTILVLRDRLENTGMSVIRIDANVPLGRFYSDGWVIIEGGYRVPRNPVLKDNATGERYVLDVFQGETIFLRPVGNVLYYDTCLTDQGVKTQTCRVLNGVLTEGFDPDWIPTAN